MADAKKILNANVEVIGNLKVTDVVNAEGEFVTVDENNNITKRTPTEVLADVGAAPVAHVHNYIHSQGIPALVWNVSHGMNKRVSVTVVDSAGTEVHGKLEYIDNNNVILTFNGAFSGSAYFN